jgi:serine/threonine protein phosphatase PrpC
VIATPDVYRYRLSPAAAALVVACDGLWDFIPQNDVTRFVTNQLSQGTSSENIAKALVHESIHTYQGTDNCTNIVVRSVLDFPLFGCRLVFLIRLSIR